jgi:hypothetical protein
MTASAINPNIDDTYPHPGVNNDLQGFRDNFSIIKTSLTSARDEITDLCTNGVRKDTISINLNGLSLTNTVLKNTAERRYSYPTTQTVDFDVDYTNGTYQSVQLGADLTINLTNFPTDTTLANKVGTLRLQLYTDSITRKVKFTANDAVIKYNTSFPFVDTMKLEIPGSVTRDPVILEVWQINNTTTTPTVFIQYKGQYTHVTGN